GIGMALITNRLRRALVWEEFLDTQSATALVDMSRLWSLSKGLLRLTFPHSWLMLVSLFMTSLMGLTLLYSVGMKPLQNMSLGRVLQGGIVRAPEVNDPKHPTQEENKKIEVWQLGRREWKTSLEGRVIGITCDSLAKAIGGYFAVVGMGIGIVILRAGISIEARRRTSLPRPSPPPLADTATFA
ncbi:MAG: hypothetical protein B7Z47_03165, partial [Chthoniobacter sp. 12-60-6]